MPSSSVVALAGWPCRMEEEEEELVGGSEGVEAIVLVIYKSTPLQIVYQ